MLLQVAKGYILYTIVCNLVHAMSWPSHKTLNFIINIDCKTIDIIENLWHKKQRDKQTSLGCW